MSKKRKNKTNTNNRSKSSSFEFSIDDTEIINDASMVDILDVFYDPFNEVYTPPMKMSGLSALTRANGTHRRCINFKVNQMAICFVDTGLLSFRDFRRAARELETFGNIYFEIIKNRVGQWVRLQHLPTLNMRKCKDNRFKMLRLNDDDIYFDEDEVLHAGHYDTGQDVYGLPDWIGCFQDVLLNSEATLFRRRYYINGSHMGYILYTNDPKLDPKLEEELKDKVSQGKGVGNFKSMFINIPNGKENAVQIIPVGDISKKDEFERVKNISADDIIVAHGIYPALAGMKPDNVGGFGDIEKTGAYYRANEGQSLIHPFKELNELLPANKKFEFDFSQ